MQRREAHAQGASGCNCPDVGRAGALGHEQDELRMLHVRRVLHICVGRLERKPKKNLN
jgi:hypothetical protein